MTEKGMFQRSKFTKGNGDKARAVEKGQIYISGSPKICKANTNRTKERNRPKYYCSRGPKYPTVGYKQIIETKSIRK